MEPQPAITQLLEKSRAVNGAARNELLELVYAELRRIAKGHLRKERQDHTLQPTALVHEAYLKLFQGAGLTLVDRAHFFAVVSQAMRRVLVDHARARSAEHRGGGAQPVALEPGLEIAGDAHGGVLDFLDLDRAIDALAHEKAALAQVIEMKYFGGMTAEETAEVVGRSVHAVRHELRLAHAWIRRELAQQAPRGNRPGATETLE